MSNVSTKVRNFLRQRNDVIDLEVIIMADFPAAMLRKDYSPKNLNTLIEMYGIERLLSNVTVIHSKPKGGSS